MTEICILKACINFETKLCFGYLMYLVIVAGSKNSKPPANNLLLL